MKGLLPLLLFIIPNISCQKLCVANDGNCTMWADCCSGCCFGSVSEIGKCVEDKNNCLCDPCPKTNCIENTICVIRKTLLTGQNEPYIRNSDCVTIPLKKNTNNPCYKYNKCLEGEECFFKKKEVNYRKKNAKQNPICGAKPTNCSENNENKIEYWG